MTPKFRAWHKILKIMRPVQRIEWICESQDQIDTVRLWGSGNFAASEVELMQWTGFLGAYEQEIYDGDIIESSWDCLQGYPIPKYIVEWEYASWRSRSLDDGVLYPLDDLVRADDVKIIGNIYQNSELLKG